MARQERGETTFYFSHWRQYYIAKQRRSINAEGGIEEIMKPLMIHDYNQNMGGVD